MVTLPSDWLRGLGIRAGDVLEMEYTDSWVSVRIPEPARKEGLLLQILKTTRVG